MAKLSPYRLKLERLGGPSLRYRVLLVVTVAGPRVLIGMPRGEFFPGANALSSTAVPV